MYRTSAVSNLFCHMIILVPFFLSSCMRWEEGWKQFKKPTRTGDVSALLDKAQDQIKKADTEKKIREFIQTYESVLEIDPHNYEALWSLGRWYSVIASSYADDKEEKKKYYLASIRCCEQGMYTNPEFRAMVDDGEKLWDACRVLSKREMPFLYYWYASRAGYWLECMHRISKITQLLHAGRIKKVLARMMEIDPTWAGGHPYVAWAARYAVLPKLLGGDLKKAEEFFAEAVEAGPNWLYIKFARAKYLHTKRQDKEAFRKDLEWVIAQDPHEADSPYPANIWMQTQARAMLEDIDDYF